VGVCVWGGGHLLIIGASREVDGGAGVGGALAVLEPPRLPLVGVDDLQTNRKHAGRLLVNVCAVCRAVWRRGGRRQTDLTERFSKAPPSTIQAPKDTSNSHFTALCASVMLYLDSTKSSSSGFWSVRTVTIRLLAGPTALSAIYTTTMNRAQKQKQKQEQKHEQKQKQQQKEAGRRTAVKLCPLLGFRFAQGNVDWTMRPPLPLPLPLLPVHS
jgi:hypothetical protein